MENKITLTDMYGKTYTITNFQDFLRHIETYHTLRGEGDGSIHEENGYYFRVTPEFYTMLKRFS